MPNRTWAWAPLPPINRPCWRSIPPTKDCSSLGSALFRNWPLQLRPRVCWYMTSPHHRSGILMALSGWRLSVPWGLKAPLAQQVRRVPQVRSEPQDRLAQLERQATQVLQAQRALKVPRVLLERTARMGQLGQQVRQEQPVLQEPLAQTEAMVLQAQQAHRVPMVVLAQQAPLELTA
jgi:hypothetical protein